MCTDFEINRYKIDVFRKHAKIVFYMRSRDAKPFVVRKHFETNMKSLRLPVKKLWLKQWFSCFR